MAGGPAPKVNDWQTVEPDDWQAAPQPAPAPPSPGFLQRFGTASGIPTNLSDLGSMLNPMNYIKAPVAYVKNLAAEGRNFKNEAGDAIENIREGGPVIPNVVGKIGSAGTEFLNRGLLAPVGGNALQNAGEDFHASNYPGLAGDVLGLYTAGLLAKGMEAKAPKVGEQVDKLTAGLSTTGGQSAAETAHGALTRTIGDIKNAAAKYGEPKTVGDFQDTVRHAINDINTEYGTVMQGVAGKQIVPTAIADAIRAKITPSMLKTPQGQAEAAALRNAAVQYEKPWSLRELDDARMKANSRLSAYYKKGDLAQYGAKKAATGVATDEAVADGVRDLVYPEIDRAAGMPPGYFRDLKDRQGNLLQLEDLSKDQAAALGAASSKIRGTPRFSRENFSAYMNPTGKVGASAHRIQNVIKKPNPEGAANARVASAFGVGPSPKNIVKGSVLISTPLRFLILGNEEDQQPPQ